MAPSRKTQKTEKIRRINTSVPRLKKEKTIKEDFLSQMPDDVLLSIFSQVNRGTLNNLKCVSKRMNQIASHDILKKRVKKEKKGDRAKEFILKRDCSGYSVIVNADYLYSYTLRDAKRTAECGTDFTGSGKVWKKSKRDCDFYMEDFAGYDEPMNYCKTCKSSKLLPDRFKHLIEKLAAKYSFEQLSLINIPINEAFLDFFFPLIKGNSLEYGLNFFNSPIDKKLPMSKFSKFVAALKSGLLILSDPKFPWTSLNEQFVINFPSSKLNISLVSSFADKVHHFTPKTEFVPVLERFDELEFAGVILEPNVLVEAIKKRVSSSDHDVRWEVSTTSFNVDLSVFEKDEFVITENDFDEYRLRIAMKKLKTNGTITIEIEGQSEGFYPMRAVVKHFIPTDDFIYRRNSKRESGSDDNETDKVTDTGLYDYESSDSD